MRSNDLSSFIAVRQGKLSSDEISYVTDIETNPQIDHIIYENGVWKLWDNKGNYFSFIKR